MSPRLVIWEQEHYLLAPVRRLSRQLPITSVRQAEEVLSILEQSPNSVLLVHWLPEHSPTVCKTLYQIRREFPHARCMVIGTRALLPHRDVMLSLGAIYFAASNRDLRPCVEIARRHLEAQQPDDLLTSIRENLPW